MKAGSPHELNATLGTLQEAAALPLAACLDPYGARLPMAACRTVIFAWLAILHPCRRDRLDPPEDLICARLDQAREVLPREQWRRFQRKFLQEVIS